MASSSPQPASARSKDIDQHDGLDWYLALCLGGLQSIIETEVERHIAAHGRWRCHVQVFREDCEGADPNMLKDGVHPGQAGCGKLLIATDAPPEVMNNVRCIQALFALVTHAASLDISIPSNTTKLSNPGSTEEAKTEPPMPHDACRQPSTSPTAATATSAPPRTSSHAEEHAEPAKLAIAHVELLLTESAMWPGALDVWKRFADDFEDSCCTSSSSPTRKDGSTSYPEHGNEKPHSANGDRGETRSKAKRGLETLKFRASVVRDGKHPFNSMDASPIIGGAVLTANPTWTVDLKEYDVEVVAFILERGVVVGLSLGGDRRKRCSHGRLPKEDKGFIEAGKRMSSLRPSTAYLMLCLAQPKTADVVVDCMCGVGTIPFLGAGWFPDVFFMGGEVDEDAMVHIKHNLRSLQRSLRALPGAGERRVAQTAAGAGVCAWDVQSLPLRDGTVDVMVVDMPFGYSCGTPRANEKLYPTALAEMARVLRPGSGRAVLLVTQPYLLGLPNIQKTRRKEKGLEKKLCRGAGRDFRGKGAAERKTRNGCVYDMDQTCVVRDSGCEGSYGHHSAPPGIELRNNAVNFENGLQRDVCDVLWGDEGSGLPDDESSVAKISHDHVVLTSERDADIWRVRDQHTVNVGGLLSSLLILDRTEKKAPPALTDRRKKWVGLGSCRKRTKEQIPQQDQGDV